MLCRLFLCFLRLLLKQIGINSEKCIEYGRSINHNAAGCKYKRRRAQSKKLNTESASLREFVWHEGKASEELR